MHVQQLLLEHLLHEAWQLTDNLYHQAVLTFLMKSAQAPEVAERLDERDLKFENGPNSSECTSKGFNRGILTRSIRSSPSSRLILANIE